MKKVLQICGYAKKLSKFKILISSWFILIESTIIKFTAAVAFWIQC